MTTSRVEDVLGMMLLARFGSDDVVRQYSSYWYPFACDFYIRSRDLYLELNAWWMHGGRWFVDDDECRAVLDEWRDRSRAGIPRYDDAVRTWTVRDVDKRATARDAGLNYVVLWDNDLRDAAAWFDAGCPDGSDWEREYSWLPESRARELVLARARGERDAVCATTTAWS